MKVQICIDDGPIPLDETLVVPGLAERNVVSNDRTRPEREEFAKTNHDSTGWS